jgi:alanine racemase
VDADDGVRPTRIEVDLGAIADNLSAIRTHVGPARVMAILKANAYGHGLTEVGAYLDRVGVDALGVAYLEEGEALRRAGVEAPVLVLSGLVGRQLPRFFAAGLQITVPSVDKLRQVDEAAAAHGVVAPVHLKVDTGMERIGVHWYSAGSLLEESLRCGHVRVEGIFSHLANADAEDLASARRQLERFSEVLGFYEEHDLPVPTRHLANSGGILQLPETHLDMVRPGIILFGVPPSPECRRPIALRPALRWTTQVVYFKVVEAGSPVSYGSTWSSDHPVRLVTLPVGYGDGYFRALGNRAEVLIGGRRHPVVGRVCMDQSMVNIEWGTAYNGDEVVLVGRQGDEEITAEELADHAGTIAYEVLTSVNGRVPRVYVGGTGPV